MIAATLFSGIGAPEQAMPLWRWAWHAEIEPFPAAVLAARHPQSINLGDVTADDFCTRALAIARPDVLVFGSPCQSFSVAGKRLGLDDPRGNLALVALGIVARLEPRWFCFENVPGLFSSFSGSEQAERDIRDRAERGGGQIGESVDAEEDRDFAAFLSGVHDIGYSGAWAVLDAQWFGVAQRRRRVFFVGHAGDWRGPAAVLLEPESLCGDTPPSRQARQAVASGLGAGSQRSGGRVGRREAAGNQLIAHSLRADGFDASEDGTGRGIPLIAAPLTSNPYDDHESRESLLIPFQTRGSNIDLGEDVTGTIGSNADRASGSAPCVAFSCKDNGADAADDVAPTMRAMGFTESHANAGGQLAVAFGGNDTSGPINVATARNGHGGPHGRLDFESETFVVEPVAFNARQDPDFGDVTHLLDTDGQSIGVLAFDHRARGDDGRGYARACNFTEELAPTLNTLKQPAVAFAENSRAELRLEGGDGAVCSSLKTGGGKVGQPYPAIMQPATAFDILGVPATQGAVESDLHVALRARMPGQSEASTTTVIHQHAAVRRLMPVECERLQGLPDNHTAITYRGKPAADGNRYKAIGNSMAVPVLRWILSRIEQVDSIMKMEAA